MSLAQILYPPPTKEGMEEWFQAHARHHEAIVAAFKQTRGVQLDSLGLYPVNVKDLSDWLQRHQQMHTAMGQLAGVQGTDLSGLDLNSKTSSDSWFFQHFLQHQGVSQACGLPI
jgi:hypothetical protein